MEVQETGTASEGPNSADMEDRRSPDVKTLSVVVPVARGSQDSMGAALVEAHFERTQLLPSCDREVCRKLSRIVGWRIRWMNIKVRGGTRGQG